MIREDVRSLPLPAYSLLTPRSQINLDQLLDVLLGMYFFSLSKLLMLRTISTGNRKYIPCLYVYNKIDSVSLEEVDRLANQPNSLVISCELDLKCVLFAYSIDNPNPWCLDSLDFLLDRIWEVYDEVIHLSRVPY